MSKIKFKRTVLRAATILQEQGYQPSERHPAPDIVQFYKELTPGVRCEIEFDLKSHFIRPKRNFSVNMLRSRLPSFPPDEYRYAWLNLTLENFMWFAYKIEAPLGGWEFEDETSLHAQVMHVQGLLRDYGIKWLEDPLSRDLWAVPDAERDAFRALLTTVVATELESYRYRLQDIAGGNRPIFVKSLPHDLHAIVELRQTRLLNPSRFVINVNLHRRLANVPYEDQIPNFPGWTSDQLDTLLRLKFGVGPAVIAEEKDFSQTTMDTPVGNRATSSQSPYWQYTEQQGLQRCIADILDKLKRYGLPWLEDLNV